MNRTGGLVFVLALLLGGCAGTGEVPEDRFYQLEVRPPAERYPAPALQGELEVEPVSADPLRSGRAIVYRRSREPLELHRYHYAFWADQPPRMVGRLLVDYLRQSGIATGVVDGRQTQPAAWRLRLQLRRFEQLTGVDASAVEVELAASLYAAKAGRTLWTRTYSEKIASAGPDMHATAEAMQQALARIFAAIAADLAATGGQYARSMAGLPQ